MSRVVRPSQLARNEAAKEAQGGLLGPWMGMTWQGEPWEGYGHVLDMSEVCLVLSIFKVVHICAVSCY